MAAPEGNQNSVGNSGGKSLNDRKLAAEVRQMTLKKIKRLYEMAPNEMSERELQLHDRVFEKLAGSVLPRLTEVTGEDGESFKIAFDPVFNQIANAEPTRQAEGDSPIVSPV